MKSKENENFKYFRQWLTTKKGIGTRIVDKVIMREDFQQEFALLVNYVAFKVTKEKGDIFELPKACTIVICPQVGFNHCIYNELIEYITLHDYSLNDNVLHNIVKNYSKSTKKPLDKKDPKQHITFSVDDELDNICQVNMSKKNMQVPNFKKIYISCNIEDSVNSELLDVDVVASGYNGLKNLDKE